MKQYSSVFIFFLSFFSAATAQTTIVAGRQNEVFRKTILVNDVANLNDPWEITYGPDDSLWVTEARGYMVRKIHPVNGGMRTVLDLRDAASGGSFAPSSFRRQFVQTQNPWPQGGMMGLAIHPDFNHATTPKKYVYIPYVRSYVGLNTTNPFTGESVSGNLFTTWLVRFTYNGSQLTSPVIMCDSLPGSNDHNSARIIIKYDEGVPYLYYALGDMGAGQFANISRTIKSQNINSYEGKILRFNLEEDGDADQGAVDYNRWIPNANPYNVTLGVQSAVWSIGIRNNQGFAVGMVNGTERFYGSSHGPFSDDEVNLMEPGKNYGHPLVIGYAADGNYNNAKAGPTTSSLPLITSEAANALAIGSTYMDPIYSNYPTPTGTGAAPWTPFYSVQTIYLNPNIDTDPVAIGTQRPQNNNGMWWSEGYSGLGLYTNTKIPGWKNSLLLASLKWGRVVRMKLNAAGTGIQAGGAGGADTVSYFGGTNRFRDVEVAANGNDIYVIMDRSPSSSGPSAGNPIVPACAGCVHKYEFLGYNNVTGTSAIPTSIPIDSSVTDVCVNGSTITIDATNNNLWVPITGPDGNVVAEIKANGNILGTVTTSFFVKSGAIRTQSGVPYLNRNITITPATQPGSNVSVRFYITRGELNNLIAAAGSGVTSVTDIAVFKNNDNCSPVFAGGTKSPVTITGRYAQSTFGHAIQADISGFSSFYFGSASSTLPFNLIGFTGSALGEAAKLHWTSSNENNLLAYEIERSADNNKFEKVASVAAKNGTGNNYYNFSDIGAADFGTTVYYRLKAIEQDGSAKFTNVIKVLFATNMFAVNIFPNPVTDKTTLLIKAEREELAQLRIVDNTGRTVRLQTIQLVKGRNSLELNISNLPTGLYYLDISGKTINEKVKLIKN